MESLSILCLAVAGFIYVNLSLRTRYKFKRASDWAAYLYVVAWGVPFLLVAWFITSLLSSFGLLRLGYDFLKTSFHAVDIAFNAVDFSEKKTLLKYLFTGILALLIAYLLGQLNRLYYVLFSDRKMKALPSLISNDFFELLILNAYIRSFPLLITLSTNKVYAGLLPSYPMLENGKLEYLTLLPLFSGYRHQDTLQVKFDINYYAHYEKFIHNRQSDLSLLDFQITFPVSEIVSLSLFDIDTFNHFEDQSKATKQKHYFRKTK